MKTFASLFCGGGLACIGMKAAGLAPLWGIDNDLAALAAYTANVGPDGILARVQDVNPSTLAVPDVLWASPPCVMFSAARSKSLDSDGTEDLGLSVIPYLEALRPHVFLLENVPPYVRSSAFAAIVAALGNLGYMVDWSTIDSSHHGVAQSRNRLILRASRDGLLPSLPARQPVVGWYAAIEDLLDTLPDSAFAPWQLQRLAAHPVYGSFLVSGTDALVRQAHQPCVTLTGSLDQHTASPRAFLLMTANTQIAHPTGTGILETETPANTVHQGSTTARAFLMSNAATEWGDGLRAPEAPAHAVTTQTAGRARAFIVDTTTGARFDDVGNRMLTIRDSADPMFTVVGQPNRLTVRAFLVDGQSNDNGQSLTVRDQAEPSITIGASQTRRPLRAGVSGRVVAMTPRALARFQSVPDTYILPEKRRDALKVIGNGVPCKVAQMLVEQFMDAHNA